MSLRSPLSRVLGSGSAKEGVSHWWLQRLTSVALIPLAIWFLLALLSLPALDYFTMRDWLAAPGHGLATLLLVLTLVWHSSLGVQVVIEDYVHHHGLKLAALVLTKFVHVALAVAGAYAVLKAPVVLKLGILDLP